jgi:hypothetical protein
MKLVDRLGYFRWDCSPAVSAPQCASRGHRSLRCHSSFGTPVGIIPLIQNIVHILIVVWGISLCPRCVA